MTPPQRILVFKYPSGDRVKKKMKYFDVSLDHAWKVSILQELLNTRIKNLYIEGFHDYLIPEMINILGNE